MKLILALVVLFASAFAYKIYANADGQPEHLDRNNGLMKEHLNTVHNKAKELGHFDEDFEDFEAEQLESEFLEKVETFKKRLPDSTARTAAYSAMQKKHGSKFNKVMASSSAKKKDSIVGSDPFYDAAAQFDITITRVTANINVSLTVPLFASVHYNAKYLSIMGNYLPNGVSIQSIAVNSQGNVEFTFVNVALATDVVRVECTQIPYITFLSSLNYNAMRLGKIRYAISDATKVQQFAQPFEVYYKTIFGKHGGNGLSLASQNDPKYFPNNGVRDINNAIDVDNSTAVIVGLIVQANFSVTLSSFVQQYTRTAKLK